jgi:DNA polymerase-3 subunit epsilon
MKNVLILDTETTGLDSFADRAIEVAVILYSVEHATVRAAFSALIAHDRNPAVRINRIPPAALVDAEAYRASLGEAGGRDPGAQR